jgi:hypothetical protein
MVMIHNIGHSVAYDIDPTVEDQDVRPDSLEGIWWLPNETATDYTTVICGTRRAKRRQIFLTTRAIPLRTKPRSIT